MIVSLIVAMDEKGGIGKDGQLPWHLSADLKRFKKLTMGHHVIMGRKTFEAIGRVLPGRKMIVLSRNPHFSTREPIQDIISIAHSLSEALSIAQNSGETEVFVIGGGEIYRQALPIAEKIYFTRVHTVVSCDVFFPTYEKDEWQLKETQYFPADKHHPYSFTWQLWIRRRDKPS